MTLLFVTRALCNGGAERVVSVLANNLSRKGHIIILYVFFRTDNDYPIDSHVIVKLPSHDYCENKGNAIERTITRIKGLRNIIKEYNPDAIIPFLYGPLRETFFASVGIKIPIVGTVRNLPQYKTWMRKALEIFILKNCAAVMFQSLDQMMMFEEKIRNKGFVLPNPVNENALVSTLGDRALLNNKKIVSFGRLEKQKNHLILIKSMLDVHKKHNDLELEIYGEGKEKETLNKAIEDNNAQSYIHLKGYDNNVQEKMKEARAFVLSSDYEGMPNALLEAMAYGLPCVSTDCKTGPHDLLGDNERGLLVEVGNAEQLSDAICKLVENDELSLAYGKRSREFVMQNMTPEIICQKLEMKLLEIISLGL